jgi:hypothetical protein
VLTLCPLGQPEKALGHESQTEPWLTPYNHQGLPVFRTEWRRRDQKMELLRRNNANSNPGAQPQTSVFRSDKGLDVANKNRAYGEGRRMFLTSLLIEQAFAQACAFCSSQQRVNERNGDVTPTHASYKGREASGGQNETSQGIECKEQSDARLTPN